MVWDSFAGCFDFEEPGNPGGETRMRPTCGMEAPLIAPVATQSHATQAALRHLNNANARETSFLTAAEWHTLVAVSFAATCTTDATALLIALDQEADYSSANFKWFQAHRRRFVYVDRIVVSEPHRGRSLAGCLYRDLFERAMAAGHDRIACEVNLEPPNPRSDAFHEKMGFVEVGRADLQPSGKTVRYWEKLLQRKSLTQ